MSPTAILNEQSMQHTLDPDSKITLGNLSPGRLSPNLFLGINLDSIGMDRNTLAMEWSSFTPSSSLSRSTQNVSDASTNGCLHLDSSASSYDDCKYLNIDQFNMEHFKAECILNLDQSMLGENTKQQQQQQQLHDMQNETTLQLDQLQHHSLASLDLQSFSLHEMEKSSLLLDLEKPIMNITVQHMPDDDKY